MMKTILPKNNLRKKYQVFTILVVMLLVTNPNLYAQSLIENFCGVKTDFQFTTDSVEMPIIDQIIIKRGVSGHKYGTVNFSSGGYGYGYGLQIFHIEFITKTELVEKFKSEKRANRSFYEIKLFDKKDALLLNIEIKLEELKKQSNGSDLFTYSLNLNKIPIVLLNKTKTINIDKIKKGKKR